MTSGYCTKHHRLYMIEYRARNKVVYSIDRKHVEELAGQPLTDEQLALFVKAIDHSSIPDALREVAQSVIEHTTEEAT